MATVRQWSRTAAIDVNSLKLSLYLIAHRPARIKTSVLKQKCDKLLGTYNQSLFETCLVLKTICNIYRYTRRALVMCYKGQCTEIDNFCKI